VGDDDLGRGAIDDIRAEGVDVGAVRRVEGYPPVFALIMVDSGGENLIAVASSANAPAQLASLEVPEEAVLAAARGAVAVGQSPF
jgi:ribokinase